jgi:hypothetical protein
VASRVVLSSIELVSYIHYMFRPYWPSSGIQVSLTILILSLTRQLLLQRISLGWYLLQPCTCPGLRFYLPNFSLVPMCGSFSYVRLLHPMNPAWWSIEALRFSASFIKLRDVFFLLRVIKRRFCCPQQRAASNGRVTSE